MCLIISLKKKINVNTIVFLGKFDLCGPVPDQFGFYNLELHLTPNFIFLIQIPKYHQMIKTNKFEKKKYGIYMKT